MQRLYCVCCTDHGYGSGVPLGGHPGLLRFSGLLRLSLCNANRGSLGAVESLSTWLPASLQVSAHPKPCPHLT